MATFPVTWTSHASSPTPGRSSPSSVGSTCCAVSPPMRPSRSGPAPPLAATRHDHVPANYGSDWLFPAGTPASPPPTVPWPPSSASTGCRCAPPGSRRCGNSSCRFPLPSSPARSASTTPPPPPASTSRQADRGASTPAATASPDHTGCRALPAGQCPEQDSIPHRPRQEQELRLGFGPARFFGALGLLEMVAVDRAVRVEADAAGSVDADPEQVVLAVLSQPRRRPRRAGSAEGARCRCRGCRQQWTRQHRYGVQFPELPWCALWHGVVVSVAGTGCRRSRAIG